MSEKKKMLDVPLAGVPELVDHIAKHKYGKLYLYRGQNVDQPLLPKVARQYKTHDSTEAEKRVLSELRMRGHMLLDKDIDDWALLCIAQHHGAATRLLDWSTNPLVGLWMALADRPGAEATNVFVYVFEVEKAWILSSKDNPSPFDIKRTRVLQPPLNNPRVAAQSGWFTAHKFNKQSGLTHSFVPLEQQKDYREKLTRFVIPVSQRLKLLQQLDKLGVNAQTMFPGMEGLCKHMSWRYECEIEDDLIL
jgi:hypothetical protein